MSGAVSRLVLLLSLSGCGGNVDLGGDEDRETPPSDPPPSDAPQQSGERVTSLPDLKTPDSIALWGDGLYASVRDAGRGLLYRCRKDDCEATLGLLAEGQGIPGAIQIEGGRLAGVRSVYPDRSSLVSYSLPRMSDEQVVIADLSYLHSPLLHDGFIYWQLSVDNGVYRCAHPHCGGGPQLLGSYERIADGVVGVAIAGRYAFWAGDHLIYRRPLDGSEPTQLLDPSRDLAVTNETAYDYSRTLSALVGDDSQLYAAVAYRSDSDSELGAERATIWRWPAQGGSGTPVWEDEDSDYYKTIRRLVVSGAELIWAEGESRFAATWQLYSCSIPSCRATKRELGSVVGTFRSVVADSTHVYWLAAPETSSGGAEVRRVPLLPQE